MPIFFGWDRDGTLGIFETDQLVALSKVHKMQLELLKRGLWARFSMVALWRLGPSGLALSEFGDSCLSKTVSHNITVTPVSLLSNCDSLNKLLLFNSVGHAISLVGNQIWCTVWNFYTHWVTTKVPSLCSLCLWYLTLNVTEIHPMTYSKDIG